MQITLVYISEIIIYQFKSTVRRSMCFHLGASGSYNVGPEMTTLSTHSIVAGGGMGTGTVSVGSGTLSVGRARFR